MYYTVEQIKKAKNVDLVKVIQNYGYQIKKEKNAYRVLGVEGGLYLFDKNNNDTQGFYWHKESQKGNAIDFCKIFFKDNYKQAIERLLGVQPLDNNINKIRSVQVLDSDKNFILPERDNNIKQSYSYLVNTRGISKRIVTKCIKYGLIRQFKENNHIYVGFIGKNIYDEPKYLMLRSTLTNSNFKKEYENSNKKYGFKVFNKESVQSLDNNKKINIYIFESPIDLLSYMTLNPTKSLKENCFLSMGGISTLTFEQFIKDYNPKISSINICFDADEVGQKNARKIKEDYNKKYKVNILSPMYKDYNQQLLEIKKAMQSVQSLDKINKKSKGNIYKLKASPLL